MTIITVERIDALVNAFGSMHENPIGALMDRFAAEQPALHLYLMGPDRHMSRDEIELLIPTVMLGWHVIAETLGRPAAVSGESVDAWLNRNAALFDAAIVKTAESERDPLPDIFARYYGQKDLMGFLVNLILNRPDGYSGVIRPAALLPMILCLKTIIDCLVVPSPDIPENDAGE